MTILGLGVAGCELGLPPPDYDQGDGVEIAQAIRAVKPGWVERVTYHPGDFVDPAWIEIQVGSDLEESDITSFSCDVITPLLEGFRQPESLGIDFWMGGSFVTRLEDQDCSL